MFFLNYLNGTVKTALMLIGLNGSVDKISLQGAYDHLDQTVQGIEEYFEIRVDQQLIAAARREILRLSYEEATSLQWVEEIEAKLEQEVIFGWPNETIFLPQFLQGLRGIYQLRANTQQDDVSCGWWTVANAKVIDRYCQTWGDQPGNLRLEILNRYSDSIIQQLLGKYVPKLLEPTEVNQLARMLDKFNKQSLKSLIDACTIESANDYYSEKFKSICRNKLHLVEVVDGQVSPCCIANNRSVVAEENEFIPAVILEMNKDLEAFKVSLLEKLISVSTNTIMFDDTIIDEELAQIVSIDRDYLMMLIEGLDLELRKQILCFVIDNKFASLINKKAYAKAMNKKAKDVSDEELTLVNLSWISHNKAESQKLEHLTKIGQIGTLAYFKALSDYFRELCSEDRNGALHFACYIKNHWFLVSVINLKGKKPVIVIMDSLNESIDDPIKVRYIQYFYDLFINNNYLALDEALAHELIKLEHHDERDEVEELLRYGLEDPSQSDPTNLENMRSFSGNDLSVEERGPDIKSRTGYRVVQKKRSSSPSPVRDFLSLDEAVQMARAGRDVDPNRLTDQDKSKFLERGHEFCSGKGKRIASSSSPSNTNPQARRHYHPVPKGGHQDEVEKKGE